MDDLISTSSHYVLPETSLEPRTMDHLVEQLNAEMGPSNGLEDVDVSRIIRLMESYCSNSVDWERYAFFDPYRYTRNFVDDGNGKYNLMVLCWGPGQTRYAFSPRARIYLQC